MPIEITEIFYPPTRQDWRNWLMENHDKKDEIWLKRYIKAANKPSISYDELVEECLCFGWIDGVVKKTEPESNVQRITPRREKGSFLSELNRQRIWKLQHQGLIIEGALDKIQNQIGDPREVRPIPDWIEMQLRADPEVWANFQAFPHFYKRLKIGWIEETGTSKSRMPEAQKRLDFLIKNTKKGKLYGTQPLEGMAPADF